jgi:hypothetical protein
LDLGSDYGIDSSRLLLPGKPEKSIILYRQLQRSSYARDVQRWNESTDPNKPAGPELNWYSVQYPMPPYGSFEQDTVAIQFLTQWILKFDLATDQIGKPVAIHSSNKPPLKSRPYLKGNQLFVPQGLSGRVTFVGIQGREFNLIPLGGHVFSIPSSLKHGVYVVRVGEKSFIQYRD